MVITLHTKDPNGVGEVLNISLSLFTNFPPSSGSETAFLTRKWDAILRGGGGRVGSYFADTRMLMVRQKFAPITG